MLHRLLPHPEPKTIPEVPGVRPVRDGATEAVGEAGVTVAVAGTAVTTTSVRMSGGIMSAVRANAGTHPLMKRSRSSSPGH